MSPVTLSARAALLFRIFPIPFSIPCPNFLPSFQAFLPDFGGNLFFARFAILPVAFKYSFFISFILFSVLAIGPNLLAFGTAHNRGPTFSRLRKGDSALHACNLTIPGGHFCLPLQYPRKCD